MYINAGIVILKNRLLHNLITFSRLGTSMTLNNQLHAPYICSVYSHTVGRVTEETANRTNDVTVLARWKHTACTLSQPYRREKTRRQNRRSRFEERTIRNLKIVSVPANTENVIIVNKNILINLFWLSHSMFGNILALFWNKSRSETASTCPYIHTVHSLKNERKLVLELKIKW